MTTEFDLEALRREATERLAAYEITRIPNLIQHATELLDTGEPEKGEQAKNLLADILVLQDQDTSSRTVGCFPPHVGSKFGDLNYVLFSLPFLIELAERHNPNLSHGLQNQLDEAISYGTLGVERRWDEETFDLHRDNKTYTNAFLCYIQALLTAGVYREDERLQRVARAQWDRWFKHIAAYGIDEFVSHYYNVDHKALVHILPNALDERMHREVRLALDHLAVVAHATTHPILKLPVCGMSRSGRRALKPGSAEPSIIKEPAESSAYQPPDDVVKGYNDRTFPYMAHGRAGLIPFCFQSWQLEHAALGSMTGGNYFPQQLHCVAAVGRSPTEREVLLLPGSHTCINGYVAQHEGAALCLFARRPNTYLRGQRNLRDETLYNGFGDVGMIFTDGWDVENEEEGRLIARAWNYTISVDTFRVNDNAPQTAELTPVQRQNLGQGRFHPKAVDNLCEYVFPEDAEWFGCTIQLEEGNDPAKKPDFQIETTENQCHLQADNGLDIKIFEYPNGELTQIYEPDSRTMPLISCPGQTLYPGDLLRQTVNAG